MSKVKKVFKCCGMNFASISQGNLIYHHNSTTVKWLQKTVSAFK